MEKKQETDWISKEKRELFCKFVNSTIMSDREKQLDKIIEEAEKTINKAFELYPDTQETTEIPF